MNKDLIIVLELLILSILLLCSQKGSFAFVIPDIDKIGQNPEIFFVEPDYFIPGDRVKIHGSNFFIVPKMANKLKINKKSVRIESATENTIEFIVPKIKLGSAVLELYTSYLGYRSSVAVYPNNNREIVPITYRGPRITGISSSALKPFQIIYLYGSFDENKELYIRFDEKTVKAEIISSKISRFVIPEKLPLGSFNLVSFYRKQIKRQNENLYFNSAFTKPMKMFNIEYGSPVFIRLSIPQNHFTSISDSEYPYMVELFFNNGLKKDITDEVRLNVINDEVVELNDTNNSYKIKNSGIAEIVAEYIWEPDNLKLQDFVKVNVDLPKSPTFNEIVIDEVFPFASGLFPDTDANKDGFAKLEDEFIELKNLTNKSFDLSTCKLYVNEEKEPLVEFGLDTVLLPDSYFVVFGSSAKEGKLNLSNSGSVIELLCGNKTIDYVAYPSGKNGNSSWQRNSNLVGFYKHPIIMFSPGEAPPYVKTENLSPGLPLGIDSFGEPSLQEGDELEVPNEVGDEENLEIIQAIVADPEKLIITENKPVQFTIKAIKEGGEEIINDKVDYKIISGENIFTINEEGLVVPLLNGEGQIEFIYEGHKTILSVSVNVKSNINPKELIINEVLSAPSEDVNGDSVFKSDEDEFVEIVNVAGKPLDLSGLVISDNTKLRHIIPFGTILNELESVVIFGGGSAVSSKLEGMAQIASTGSLGLNNSGLEKIIIATNEGTIIDSIEFDNANLKGVSLNRKEDLGFVDLEPHNISSLLNYSPGLGVDGLEFKK